MTETGNTVERLKRLHAAPKNTFGGNLRSVSQAQLDVYYAMHAAFPALLAVVEAAQDVRDLWPRGSVVWCDYDLASERLHSQASDEGKAE